MPTGLHRYSGSNDLHFITCSCYQRKPFLSASNNRDCFLRILEETRQRYRFVLVGYVVMPEHIHLLLSRAERKNSWRLAMSDNRSWIHDGIQQKRKKLVLDALEESNRIKSRATFDVNIDRFYRFVTTECQAAIEIFNAEQQSASEKIQCYLEPRGAFVARRPSYPSGQLRLEVDRQAERAICKYEYATHEGSGLFKTETVFSIRACDDHLSLFNGEHREPDPARAILGTFFTWL